MHSGKFNVWCLGGSLWNTWNLAPGRPVGAETQPQRGPRRIYMQPGYGGVCELWKGICNKMLQKHRLFLPYGLSIAHFFPKGLLLSFLDIFQTRPLKYDQKCYSWRLMMPNGNIWIDERSTDMEPWGSWKSTQIAPGVIYWGGGTSLLQCKQKNAKINPNWAYNFWSTWGFWFEGQCPCEVT